MINEEDEENLGDLLNQLENLQELEDMFGDEEPDYQNIMDIFGVDVAELERDMANFEQKMKVEYSQSNVDSIDPSYAYPTDSGFDLFSTEEIEIESFGRSLIPTGLHIDIPDGYEVQVRSKSGLALKQGLMVLNSPGTVDQGYTGELQVILFNTTKNNVIIKKGQKIAQAVISPVVSGKWIKLTKVDNINNKDRNEKGFGSTGI
jgi:dUTP pyrophosphatase